MSVERKGMFKIRYPKGWEIARKPTLDKASFIAKGRSSKLGYAEIINPDGEVEVIYLHGQAFTRNDK